ncbi:MAG TPA: dTMP kinase [Pirellulales bacterium]
MELSFEMFFSFDGLDGAGKSTQTALFIEWLESRRHQVVRCQDPGSTPLGERLRAMLLARELPIDRMAEMLLFMAARAQLVNDVIRPALAQGKTIVCDRYLMANIVYQGHAAGLDPEMIRRVGHEAVGETMPDLVLLLDLPPESARGRMNRPADHMESQGEAYQARLREGFLREAARDPQRVAVIDAQRDIESVQQAIRAAAEKVLSK